MALREAIAKRAPDVIALQEVWLKAAGGGKEGSGTRCGRDEWRTRDERTRERRREAWTTDDDARDDG